MRKQDEGGLYARDKACTLFRGHSTLRYSSHEELGLCSPDTRGRLSVRQDV